MVLASVPSYSEAIEDVKVRVAASRSSFHAGMAILPKSRREAMYALYAFCREVDDIADDGATFELRTHGLQEWREKITSLFRGHPSNTITSALNPAIRRFNLKEDDFQSIIDGMAMDAGTPICAPDYKTLDLYCDRVASAVGRISVRIFGDASSNAMSVAYHLGRALQLTNILRDLHEDALRGRLYLPEELLSEHQITSREPLEVLKDKNLPLVCRALGAEAKKHFQGAQSFINLCDASALRPAKIMKGYYSAILERLLINDWRDLSFRVRLPKWKKILLVLKHLVG